jgi:hypothetical protein
MLWNIDEYFARKADIRPSDVIEPSRDLLREGLPLIALTI